MKICKVWSDDEYPESEGRSLSWRYCRPQLVSAWRYPSRFHSLAFMVRRKNLVLDEGKLIIPYIHYVLGGTTPIPLVMSNWLKVLIRSHATIIRNAVVCLPKSMGKNIYSTLR